MYKYWLLGLFSLFAVVSLNAEEDQTDLEKKSIYEQDQTLENSMDDSAVPEGEEIEVEEDSAAPKQVEENSQWWE